MTRGNNISGLWLAFVRSADGVSDIRDMSSSTVSILMRLTKLTVTGARERYLNSRNSKLNLVDLDFCLRIARSVCAGPSRRRSVGHQCRDERHCQLRAYNRRSQSAEGSLRRPVLAAGNAMESTR